jgi:predicted phage terminase large subunit-like protein
MAKLNIGPQSGPQETFLTSVADIAIYGGAAGGGKTWALLLDPMRWVKEYPDFGGVIFRRTSPEITKEGGLWDESMKLYPPAVPKIGTLDWRFRSGANIGFGHLQHEDDKFKWHGAQICYLGFDELTRFTESQFWYMLSRNRSGCGVRPYVRATCNPEPGWVAELIAWWIDDEGFPIPERAGVLRWFARVDNLLHWFDSRADALRQFPDIPPKSLTFIPAKLSDNPALTSKDPGYLANLLAQPYIEQQRLLHGNWLVSSDGGEWPASYFTSSIWFDDWPKDIAIRTLGLDPSKGKDAKHGDYSAIVRLGRSKDGTLWADADLQRRPTGVIVDAAIEAQRDFRADGFAIETNQFQELLKVEIETKSRAQGIMLPCYGLNNQVNKLVRIRRLGPHLAAGNLRFKANSPGAKLLVQQLREFPNADHDDGPDGLEMALRLMIYLHNGRSNGGAKGLTI